MSLLSRAVESRATSYVLGAPANLSGFVDQSTGNWISGGGQTAAGVAVSESTAMRYTALWCAVRVISETMAHLPLHVIEEDAAGRKSRAKAHPCWRLLHDAPNPEQTSFEFREMLSVWVCTQGRAAAEIVWDGKGYPVALWPIPGNCIRWFRGQSGAVIYEVREPSGATRQLRSDQVLVLRGFGNGLSIIANFREAIGAGIAQEEYAGRYFGNGATPLGVLEHPAQMTDTGRRNVRDSWQSLHGGASNAHRVALLEEGLKFTPISVNARDSQFLESRTFSISEFGRIYRIPLHKLMDYSHATFSNVEHLGIEFVTDVVGPTAARIEQRFNASLFLPSEAGRVYSKFNLSGLMRGDQAARQSYYTAGIAAGWMSPDEVRDLEDMNPQDGGIGQVYRRDLNASYVGPGADTVPDADETPGVADAE